MAICPHNLPALYAHSNFVPKPRTFELVGEPHRIEWHWLANQKVSFTNGDLDSIIVISHLVAKLPLNLKTQSTEW